MTFRPPSLEALELHPDRLFDPEPVTRGHARTIYERTRALPIVSPHGHVDPYILAADSPFTDAAALLLTPNHYIHRLLYSHGVSMQSVGVPTLDGSAYERDPRQAWREFSRHVPLFRGTPTGLWFEQELVDVLQVPYRLTPASADFVFDAIAERLATPAFRPRALFERFKIDVLATTDAATDSLQHHAALRHSGWAGRVIPTFRPDALFRISSSEWRHALAALEQIVGRDLLTFPDFVAALAERRRAFRALGATATDHAMLTLHTAPLTPTDAEQCYQAARQGLATMTDEHRLGGQLLQEMARLSLDDGLVMQLHPGSYRDHNPAVLARFGRDAGADIPVAGEYTRSLQPLLAAFGNDPRLRIVLFTLDESCYARELAPLAGHWPALRLGAPWWFHDSPEGMLRFREQVTETAGLHNTVGFIDDTRAFCSIPVRHDIARRIDATWLARQVARHQISIADAIELAVFVAYELPQRAYRLDTAAGAA